jgi:hypothetical protein
VTPSFAREDLSESECNGSHSLEAANSPAAIDQLVGTYGLSQKQREVVASIASRETQSTSGVRSKRRIWIVVSPASSRPTHQSISTRKQGAHLSRRGGFIGWRKVVDHLRDGDYEIMCAVCDDWFVAPDDIGAERASEFSVSKLDQIVDARLGKWTVITCNFTCEQIADQMDVRIASRLGRSVAFLKVGPVFV